MTRSHKAARRRGLRALRLGLVAAGCAVLAACGWSPEPPAPGGAFRFAVFGDGPYSSNENGRARRVSTR